MATIEAASTELPKGKEALEQQYIQLLELRIAQLETLVGKSNNQIQDTTEDITKNASAPAKSENSAQNDTKPSAESDSAVKGEKSEKEDKKEDDGDKKQDDEKDKEKEKEKDKPMARVRHLISRWSDDKMDYEEIEATKAAEDAKSPDKVSDDAVEPTIFRRVMDLDNPKKVYRDEIEITSPELKRIYNEITTNTAKATEDSLHSTTQLTLSSPFKSFIWYWDEFEAACKPVDSDTEDKALDREDLKQLMALIRKSQAEPYFKARDASLPKGSMPWEYLWALFRAGTRVYAKTFMDEMQMLEVNSCNTPSGTAPQWTSNNFEVLCTGLDWDGSKFSALEYTFNFRKNNEQKETQIDSLEAYPVQFHKGDDLSEKLLERGKTFFRLCNPNKFVYHYSGAVLAVKPSQTAATQMLKAQEQDDDTTSTFSGMGENGGAPSSRKEYTGQIIIDALSFLRAYDDLVGSDQAPPLGEIPVSRPYSETLECTCKACTASPVIQWHRKSAGIFSLSRQWSAFEQDPASQDRFMMCPPRLLGYALKAKTWAQFRIESCKEIDDGDRRNYFQTQLQLDDDYKQMLMAFVNNHPSSRSESGGQKDSRKLPKSLDVIEGKGKGLAILLHGPPGVGKTLTAETIALATVRPLLVVSVAEIGTKAANAESRLNIYFAMAARWGAILLIDEADVFLEERVRTDNPERNMLVSVLLRSLEYYEGIIFLTTNRIRAIDVAVQSRMHLAIQYKRLSQKQKANIYQNLLDKLPDSTIHKGERKSMYRMINDQLCRRNEMNGRQIRNIVSAAIALAKEREKTSEEGEEHFKLKFEDLRRVHETTTDFLDSLKDTLNKARQRNEAAEEDEDDD